ncbi:putative cobalt-precorrin-4 C(11)-methyltransferase [Microcystis aeruginosa PCC 9806]|uniref:Precorrin-4 C(11)-methyltransferase n=2 Tax=Microcystis TaxID=1125 RepID=A0A552LDH2_9CHRO|nr:precorrin-4 C(11)-methyltransferase [Microcystis aeruginosa]TRV18263.1 MAG: precorrin-4 C(11)-methyltransferase [Microcystis flos-aquae Mf_WU_F_19750830_S460]CCI16305.1 putative cobalt-precorrin-4 C(11)-methyltransferase [Microcystis aeruginosa PCC 9806]
MTLMDSSALSPAVYFIGAGPGDPELLTVKAYKILQKADVIVFADSLVPKQILEDTRKDAELIPTSSITLEEIIPLMIDRVRQGLAVVRLQSGDLSLYSAIQEQIELLTAADIPFQLIPGISAFQGLAAKLALELTIPELVQTIILTRVEGKASPMPESEELASLAAHKASLCLYLAARHVDKAQEKLLQRYPPEQKVAVCFRLGWPDEKIWVVPLSEMAQLTHRENLTRTTLYLISPALNQITGTRSQLYHPQHSHLFRPHP